MNNVKLMETIKNSIVEETNLERADDINELTTAQDVPGWDSLAHVRIVMNIELELELDTEVPMNETYEAKNVLELAQVFEKLVA